VARVEVPEGCRGIDFPDGSKANGRGDGLVTVNERQAAMVRANGGDVKVVGASFGGFASGPWLSCAACGREFLRDGDETRCARCRENEKES
jgi:hypothetical protein